MTELFKVTVTSRSADSDPDCVNKGVGEQRTVPVCRLLYSFHSSGTEIQQLLGSDSLYHRYFALQALQFFPLIFWQPLADAITPDFVCLPERSCSTSLPDWLQLRVAQCSLSLVEDVGSHGGGPCDQGAPCSGVALPLQVHPPPDAAPAVALQHRQQPSSIRWKNLSHEAATLSFTVESVDRDSFSNASQGAPSDVQGASTVPSRDPAVAACESAATVPPQKRQKQQRSDSCTSPPASPPQIYQHDVEYQRYVSRTRDMRRWVRQALLDR
jgi:hypothetical protein